MSDLENQEIRTKLAVMVEEACITEKKNESHKSVIMYSFGPKAQKSSSKGKWLLTILVTFVETLVTLSPPQYRFTYHSFANKLTKHWGRREEVETGKSWVSWLRRRDMKKTPVSV